MTEQHEEEESLRRWAREQAEIERQTDALVLRTLTAMVTAAEDLKSKLRRDTESMLEEYRKTKRGLENEISLSTAERQRFRREAEQERDTLIAEATAQARSILDAAEREREQLLRETRTMEQRLRGIEGQIRAVFGQATDTDEEPASAGEPPAAPAPASPFTAGGFGRPLQPRPAPVAPAAPAPATPAPAVAGAAPQPAIADDFLVDDAGDDVDDEDAEPTAVTTPTPPPAPAFIPAPPPPVVTAPPSPAQAAPPQRRLVELVFDGVPGYQQASTLERAVDDLVPDGEVDIVDFEGGQLVLNVQVADLEAFAHQLVEASPAPLELEGVDGDRATFHCP